MTLALSLKALATAALIALPTPTLSGELRLDLGADPLDGAATLALGLGFQTAPIWSGRVLGRDLGLGVAAAFDADLDRDLWAGAGLALTVPLGSDWRLEASVLPGVYAEGRGQDLGSAAPMIRSQLGLSRAFAPGWRLGASIGHKSNAGTARRNPGLEALLISLHRVF